MSRSLLFFLFLCNLTYNIHGFRNRHILSEVGIPIQQFNIKNNEELKKADEASLELKVSSNKKDNISVTPSATQNHTHGDNVLKPNHKVEKTHSKDEGGTIKVTQMESGALLRGVSVVVVLTTIAIVYIGLRTYCGKKHKNPVMVNKYGVRTRRSDIEMTPLPLDEEEDDETLFDIHNQTR